MQEKLKIAVVFNFLVIIRTRVNMEAIALHTFEATMDDELSFNRCDRLRVSSLRERDVCRVFLPFLKLLKLMGASA